MPNMLEMELKAVHNTIAEIKKRMDTADNLKQYVYLLGKLEELEAKRLELLEQLEVEI